MYCNIVFMIDIFVISKITQYRYYVIAITDVRSLGLSTKWRTLMIKKTMKVRENTFRKLEDPFENGAAKKYVFYVKVDDVAEGIPMATNPRDQKLTSGVATAIKESLLSNDGYFHLKNRGIVLSAESVHYNNKEKIATIIFSDELSHGNIDGGHTYKIVCEHKGENLEQYVQFEVMTGVEDIIENLAEARNTSVQVDAKSMAELAEKFDPIKEGLEGMPFFKRIAFKQNQISVDDETGKKNKMIDAREIVAIISMFNISLYDALHHPIDVLGMKGKSRVINVPDDRKEFWKENIGILRNPVIRKFVLREDIKLEKKAGISALCEYSLLSDNAYPTYAVTKKKLKASGVKMEKQASVSEDIGCVVLELGYFIDFFGKGLQDPLSVALSLTREEQEERVKISVNEMLEEYVWSKD